MAGRRTIRGSSFGGACAALALLALSACGGLPAPGGGAAPAASAARTTQLVETDVEAPEVFQATDQGLWDGRPSLGGVWVAHPDVDEPERVVIRNQDNGQFVIGALFRRERENPGPPIQVSSDAAEAIGMLAGAPAELNVTALRREEAAEPEPTEATDPIGIPEEAPAEAGVAADAAAPDAAATGGVTTTSLDSGEAVAAAAPAEAPAAPPAAADAGSGPGSAAAVASATAAILGGATPAAAPSPSAPAASAPASSAPAATSLDRPFIQLGIFSVEANADELAREMTALGLPARVAGATTQGQEFWRVLVGPAPDEATRASYLARVQAEGFADAYAVRN